MEMNWGKTEYEIFIIKKLEVGNSELYLTNY